jgi:hypothetical protein
MTSVDDIRQRTWDFALTLITMVLLAGLGVQSFVGTFVVWWSTRAEPTWQQGPGYANYVTVMNEIAAPMIVALVVVMGLCVPKRLFARRVLLWVSVAMVAIGVVAGLATGSLANGLTVYLLLSAVIQLGVVVMTVAGVRGPSYLTEGRLTKTGSGLLHLGFIIFAVVVVALQQSPAMAPVFWLSAVLVGGGTALSFYANTIAWRRVSPRDETSFEWHEDEDEQECEGDGADTAELADKDAAERETPDEDAAATAELAGDTAPAADPTPGESSR